MRDRLHGVWIAENLPYEKRDPRSRNIPYYSYIAWNMTVHITYSLEESHRGAVYATPRTIASNPGSEVKSPGSKSPRYFLVFQKIKNSRRICNI